MDGMAAVGVCTHRRQDRSQSPLDCPIQRFWPNFRVRLPDLLTYPRNVNIVDQVKLLVFSYELAITLWNLQTMEGRYGKAGCGTR